MSAEAADPQADRTAPALPATGVDKAWAVGLVLGLLVLAFIPLLAEVVFPAWQSVGGFYGHGIVVVALIGSLVWQDRSRIFGSADRGSFLYAFGALVMAVIWLGAWAANLLVVQLAAMVGVALLACCAVLGLRSIWSFGLPFGLLALAMPMWSPIQPALQTTATSVVDAFLRVSGIPVFIQGNMVHIPDGVFEIERGCSGIGFLLVSLTLSGYLVLSNRPRFPVAAAAVATAVLLALAANWIRIFAIVLIAHQGGMDQTIVHQHEWLGWAVFAALALPTLWLGAGVIERAGGVVRDVPAEHRARISGGFLTLVVLFSAAPPLAAAMLDYLHEPPPATLASLPAIAAGYPGREADEGSWQPDFPEADFTDIATYDVGDGEDVVDVFTAGYARQTDGHEVVSILNDLGGPGWRSREQSTHRLAAGDSVRTVSMRRFVDTHDEAMCVLYWYRIGNAHAGNEVEAKIEQIRQRLLGRADARIVAMAYGSRDDSCEPAGRAQLVDLAEWFLGGSS